MLFELLLAIWRESRASYMKMRCSNSQLETSTWLKQPPVWLSLKNVRDAYPWTSLCSPHWWGGVQDFHNTHIKANLYHYLFILIAVCCRFGFDIWAGINRCSYSINIIYCLHGYHGRKWQMMSHILLHRLRSTKRCYVRLDCSVVFA